MLPLVGVEQGDGVAVSDRDDAAGEYCSINTVGLSEDLSCLSVVQKMKSWKR